MKAIIKNIALALFHNTNIESQNNKGLNVPNTQNHIICLNAVIINAARVSVSNNHIRFIGRSFAINISIKYDNNIHLDVF